MVFTQDLSVEKEVIVSSLINALPVPSGDVSAAAILEFRGKREAELHAFDEIYLSIIKSPDQYLMILDLGFWLGVLTQASKLKKQFEGNP